MFVYYDAEGDETFNAKKATFWLQQGEGYCLASFQVIQYKVFDQYDATKIL